MKAQCASKRLVEIHRAQRDYLTQKREQVETKLREAKAGRTESQRDRQMKEAVGKLKQLFPGASTACVHNKWTSSTLHSA